MKILQLNSIDLTFKKGKINESPSYNNPFKDSFNLQKNKLNNSIFLENSYQENQFNMQISLQSSIYQNDLITQLNSNQLLNQIDQPIEDQSLPKQQKHYSYQQDLSSFKQNLKKQINSELKIQDKENSSIKQKDKNLNQKEERQWSEQYFQEVNTGKKLSEGFLCQKNQIIKKLKENNYYLGKYLISGGEGDIFEGYKQSEEGKRKNYVLKVYFHPDEKSIEEEIQIMNTLFKQINIINLFDTIKSEQFSILVLEKCKYSLREELNKIQNKEIEFTQIKLFQMIFDLLDGLISMRLHNILHLDIKPPNILIDIYGNYVFTDFGCSSIYKQNQAIQCKGYTKTYAPYEQLHNTDDISFKSDVYSLGVTLQQIIQIYKKVNKDDRIIQNFEKIISDNMIKDKMFNREDCLNLHQMFYEQVNSFNYERFLYIYQLKTNKMSLALDTQQYRQKKDLFYFFRTKLYYLLIQLKLLKKYLQLKEESSQFIGHLLTQIGECHLELENPKEALNYFSQFAEIDAIQEKNYKKIIDNQILIGRCQEQLFLYSKALKTYLGSLDLAKNYKDKKLEMFCLNMIGVCYYKSNELSIGLFYLQESYELSVILQLDKSVYGSLALNNIGICYSKTKDFKKAIIFFKESLHIKKSKLQGNNPLILDTLNSIVKCYLEMNDFENCENYLLQSQKIIQEMSLQNYRLTIYHLNLFGQFYMNQNQFQNAINYYQQSEDLKQQISQENLQLSVINLNNIGFCYLMLNESDKAVTFLQTCIDICLEKANQLLNQQALQENFGYLLQNAGRAYKNIGKYQIAIQNFMQSLEIQNKLFQGNHPNILFLFQEIGHCFQQLNNLQNSILYYQKSLKINICQNNQIEKINSLHKIGKCYLQFYDFKQSLQYFQESLQTVRQILPINHPLIATILNDAGLCLKDSGDYQNSLKYLNESLEIRKQLFQRDNIDVADSLNNIGVCLLQMGDYSHSLLYLLEALDIKKQIKGLSFRSLATALQNIGICYQHLGNFEISLKYLKESYEIMKQNKKESDLLFALILSNIGLCYIKLGDSKLALNFSLQSLEINRKICQRANPIIADTLLNIGICYLFLEDFHSFQECILESVEIKRQIYQGNHPQIVQSLKEIAAVCLQMKNYEQGIGYLQESLVMQREIYQGNHPEISDTLYLIGFYYNFINEYQSAYPYIQQCILMNQQLFKKEHPLIAQSLYVLGQIQIKQGKKEEGISNLFKSLEMNKQIYKRDHINIANALKKIADFYFDSGDQIKGTKYISEFRESIHNLGFKL